MARSWAFILPLLLLAACAPQRPPVPVRTVPVTSELLLERLQAQATAYSSLRGVAKVRIETGGKSLAGTQVLLAQKPDLLRAETLSPFGNPLLLVAAEGGMLRVMIPGEGRFLQGDASYRNIQRFTRLPLQLSDLVRLLLWQVPLIPYRASQIEGAAEGDSCLLLRADEDVRQELLFDRELRLKRSSYYQGGDLILQIDYDRFAGELPFPRNVRLEMPKEESVAALTFSEMEVNPRIPLERFQLQPPPGYSIEPLP